MENTKKIYLQNWKRNMSLIIKGNVIFVRNLNFINLLLQSLMNLYKTMISYRWLSV